LNLRSNPPPSPALSGILSRAAGEGRKQTMQTLTVSLADRSYPIHIGSGLLARKESFAPFIAGTTVAIVTNETVAPLYLPQVKATIASLGKSIIEVILPDGEEHKTTASLDRIYTAMLAAKCDRKTTIIALGGGVIGDVAGFAAATYQRGVSFIQVPTTLLSQVDSSMGGKTAINHSLGKNMIGAFHQPVAVISDTDTLKTLPAREYASGLAEVVKHALIFDAEHFAELEANVDALNARDAALLTRVIAHSCKIKADVVKQDERETKDVRALLNLGHTFGHAIETEMGYGAWFHGEAVSAGMVLAAKYNWANNEIAERSISRIEMLLSGLNLPIRAPNVPAKNLLSHMQRDKKNEGGTVTLILMKRIGEAYVDRNVQEQNLLAFLQKAVATA
jgi:3-dehydroquinate synthase